MLRKMNFETVSLTSLDPSEIEPSLGYGRPTILVVDDEALIADSLGMILERNGYRVAIAYDGKSALQISRTVPPDLLLSDVAMPGMSGIDLAIEIQQNIPNCRVILFSGHASTLDLLGAAHHTGREFTILAKPLHPTELLRRLTDTLASRTSHAELANENNREHRENLV